MATISVLGKHAVARILSMTGIVSYFLKHSPPDRFIILMYHRVLNRNEINSTHEPGMYVEAKTFDLHVSLLKDQFNVIGLKELVRLKKEKQSQRSRIPCVITFDDGWLDFYTNAYPILMKYETPATVFLPTDYIGSRKWFWTDRLAFLLAENENKSCCIEKTKDIRNPIARNVASINGDLSKKINKAIRILKAYGTGNIDEIINELATAWGSDPNPPGRAFMSWDEAAKVARSGLIEFGSHTASHPILTTISDKEVQEELKRSKDHLLEHQVVDPEFIPFCYPNGNFDERIKSMVEDAGFSAAVTTLPGWNGPEEENYALHRIGLHQDMCSNSALFKCKMVGLI